MKNQPKRPMKMMTIARLIVIVDHNGEINKLISLLVSNALTNDSSSCIQKYDSVVICGA